MRTFPKDFQKVVDFLKSYDVNVMIDTVTYYIKTEDEQSICIHHNYDLEKNGDEMAEYQRNPDVIAALSEEQYWVTQENGTERPGTGALLNNKQPGLYVDIVSGEPLFTSGAKFDSGCGWPSFTKPVETQHVKELRDSSLGMVRVEVRSLHGDSH